MSQAKVDKYKKEKKNREKNIKKAKVKKVLAVLLCSAIVGICIGFPLGKHLYKVSYEKRLENATISAAIYDYWYQEYWDMNYGELIEANSVDDIDEILDELGTGTDATPSDSE